jgi:hypothetical protein
MPLLGKAALLLSFDIAPEAIEEHDDWHTHEHLPERLSIPGFLRGTRWVATRGGPRYLVLYEVAELATLTSAAYSERLDNPSAWTAKIMPYYRGMRRGLCTIAASTGLGIGHAARALRFRPPPSEMDSLEAWLLRDVLPPLPSLPGIGSAHLLKGAATAPMTREQSIRGADAGVDMALVVTGYRDDALVEAVTTGELGARGAQDIVDATYRLDYSLACEECA